ncbi:CHAT domain-containing protein [Plantactinospora sp. ZYX-F-223]|uniref:CHAT domain-containing tetratricopeptide repeat protein n=1 Tax=Plantactinospora sp. ZYX-F-223 TaxID=3144103 RepID=UPI0031FDF3CD
MTAVRLPRREPHRHGRLAPGEAAPAAGEADLAYQLATRRHERGDMAGALAAYRRAVSLGHAESAANLSGLLLELGRHDEAAGVLQDAVASGGAAAAYNVGDMYLQFGESALAEQAFTIAAGSSHPVVAPMAALQLAELCQRQQRIRSAKAHYRRLIDAGPGRFAAQALSRLTVMMRAVGKERAVRRACRRARRRYRTATDGDIVMAMVLDIEGDVSGARAAWERASRDADAPTAAEAALALGTSLRDEDRPAAAAALRRAVDADDSLIAAEAAVRLGDLLMDDGDETAAEEMYERATRLEWPGPSMWAAVSLAKAYLRRNEVATARTLLDRAEQRGEAHVRRYARTVMRSMHSAALADDGVDVELLDEVMLRFVSAQSSPEMREILTDHPQLITEGAECLLRLLIEDLADDGAVRTAVPKLRRRLSILHRCRESGIADAFAEMDAASRTANTALRAVEAAIRDKSQAALIAATDALAATSPYEHVLEAHLPEAFVDLVVLRAELLSELAQRRSEPDDFAAALEAHQHALQVLDDGRFGSASEERFLRALLPHMLDRFAVLGSADPDLDRVLSLYELLMATAGSDDDNLVFAYASLLVTRFEHTGDLAAVQKAIELFRDLVASDPDPLFANALVTAESELLWSMELVGGHEAGGQDVMRTYLDVIQDLPGEVPQDVIDDAARRFGEPSAPPPELDRTERTVRATLAASDATGAVRASRLVNLARVLLMQHAHRPDAARVREAVELCEQAEGLITDDSTNVAMLFLNQSTAHQILYRATGDTTQRDAASVAARRAVEAAPTTGPVAQRVRLNAAQLTSGQHGYGPSAAAAFRAAAQAGHTGSPHLAVNTAQVWAAAALAAETWPDVMEAGQHGLDAMDRLVGAQRERQHQETWLQHAGRLAAQMAYAAAQTGDYQAAVHGLERTRARLLAATIDADRRNGSGGPEGNRAESSVTRIAAGDGAPIVYLSATSKGGLALIVRAGTASPEALWLPLLTQQAVTDNYLRQVMSYILRRDGQQVWIRGLDRLTSWLWQAAIGPLMESLTGVDEVLVVAEGDLAAMPLHAAWTPDATRVSGRRYAIDHAAFRYVPNAAVARATEELAASLAAGPESVLIVGAPTNATPELAHVERELAEVRRLSPAARLLTGSSATRAAVLSGLDDSTVLHMACHGRADLLDPLDSALFLAGNDTLTVSDLMWQRLRGLRLVVMTACETGQHGAHLPNELIGMPAALIQARVAGVVAPLWAIDDESAALTAIRFHFLWRAEGLRPAQALRHAQIWVRDSTNAEKADLADLIGRRRPAGPGAQRLWDSAREHRAVIHWGAFFYTGS